MCPVILKDTVVNANHIAMADVVTIDVVTIVLCWQMLCLRFVADLIANI